MVQKKFLEDNSKSTNQEQLINIKKFFMRIQMIFLKISKKDYLNNLKDFSNKVLKMMIKTFIQRINKKLRS